MTPTRLARRPTRPRVRGVSLIEVLVALLIFSFGLLGVVALQARMSQAAVSAEDTSRAAALANQLAAQMWNAGTFNLPAATVDAWVARVADPANGGLPNGVGVVTVDVANRTADIAITWRSVNVAATAPQNRFTTQVVMPLNQL